MQASSYPGRIIVTEPKGPVQPRINVEKQSARHVVMNGQITIPCIAQGNPVPTYRWAHSFDIFYCAMLFSWLKNSSEYPPEIASECLEIKEFLHNFLYYYFSLVFKQMVQRRERTVVAIATQRTNYNCISWLVENTQGIDIFYMKWNDITRKMILLYEEPSTQSKKNKIIEFNKNHTWLSCGFALFFSYVKMKM